MPNQVNEDELQKAIDDITRNATGGVEGSASDFANPAPAPVSPAAAPSMPPIMGSGAMIGSAPETPETPTMVAPATPEMSIPESKPEEQVVNAGNDDSNFGGEVDDIARIKSSALRDLSDLLDKMDITPERKFGIYHDMMTENHDLSVVDEAYQTAKQISDEKERGNALLELVEFIDQQ